MPSLAPKKSSRLASPKSPRLASPKSSRLAAEKTPHLAAPKSSRLGPQTSSHPAAEPAPRPMSQSAPRSRVARRAAADAAPITRGRSAAPPARRDGDTARRLIAAAGAELAATGGSLEMAAVAARARVSIGLAYHYFGSKAGLVAAVVEDFYDRYDAVVNMPNPAPGAGWGAREKRRLEALVAFHYAEPLSAVLLTSLWREPEVATVEARRLAAHIDIGVRNIRNGQAHGDIPAHLDPRLLVAMIMGGFRQAMVQALAERPRPKPKRLTEHLWDFVAALARLRDA